MNKDEALALLNHALRVCVNSGIKLGAHRMWNTQSRWAIGIDEPIEFTEERGFFFPDGQEKPTETD